MTTYCLLMKYLSSRLKIEWHHFGSKSIYAIVKIVEEPSSMA